MSILNNTIYILPIAGFLSLFLLCFGIIQYLRTKSHKQELIDKIKSPGTSVNIQHNWSLEPENKQAVLNPLIKFLKNLTKIARIETDDFSQSKRLKFLRAGIRMENAPSIFYGLKLLLVVLLPSIFMISRLTLFKITDNQITIAIFVIVSLLSYYLPDIWLRHKSDKRKERLLKSLPDGLDLLVVCVEAGMGMDEAINRVAKEIKLTSPDLSDEFKFLNLELRAGKERHVALENLALRTNIDEMRNLVTLLIQSDKFGTSMAHTLRVYSETFRIERMQKAEELAAKIPVKLVIPLVLFIFPSLFVAILGPAFIRIFRNIIMRG